MAKDDNKCGHNHDEECEDTEFLEEDEEITLVLFDEEGNEHTFILLAEIEMNDNVYRVVMPEEPAEGEEEEVILFKVIIEGEEEYMVDIEDDEEWEMVADAWQELIEEEDL